ncbi:hypothetical protein CP500_005575 [Tychonema bourrellyi FEM_GT703]|uniref:Uncharacterized protein n=2 Tax=Tychonema bourrellyi TaxID=54313 RepID=A0A2G4F3M3_9CYAN|nr:hypothetical protein CP500_005575 [Tychonema bourrellyi FEM_GT703]
MQLLRKRYREGFMIDTKSLQFGTIAEFETPCRSMDLKGKDIVVATPDRSAGGAESRMTGVAPHCVRLALQELKCFEVVEHQFRYWGLTFTNVVAIQPSNPAFLTASGTTILMGAPKSGQIEVSFKYPVRFVSGLVTSSRRTVLSACDADGIQIAQDEMPGPNLVGSSSPIDPSTELCVKAPNISKVTFYAFDGQLVVHDLIFGF